MYEPSHTFLDGDERAMLVVFANGSLDDVTLFKLAFKFFPRILLERFNGERDLAVLDFYYLGTNFISYLKHRSRVLYQAPVKLRDVYEALEAVFKLQEYSEVHESSDGAIQILSHSILAQDFLFLFRV